MTDGIIERDGDRVTFRYERPLTQPVAMTWQAITDPAEITRWMGVGVEEFDLRPGGRIVMVHMGTHRVEDEVLAVDPPHRLEHTYFKQANPSAVVTWEVSEMGGGSRLTLTHALDMDDIRAVSTGQDVDPTTILARNGAGWHHLLDTIELRLRGEPIPDWPPEDRQSLQKHYTQLVP
ncbi:SRPBCC domain-containing protein [Actinomadura rupiterrae]|uniref:SRPBCC domain-containing protein n=1 Tax=Actinomadura rupiterrae TaxID=559627 RepID=UPI0020A5802B|nr:SRPBCC domain-containing protein [Actinomadura rupiterrae]MCP2341568.1 uncharacterized protein YndB with AHSA1/START domain [Actinomadura rupiterrae]